MSNENKAVVRNYLEALWNEHDYDIIDDVFAPEFEGHLASPSRGTEAAKDNVRAFHAAFPDTHLVVDHVFGEDDMVSIRWTVTGTHKGEFWGVQPTGKKVRFSGITNERLSNGKVVELWAEFDLFGLLKQLGAGPPNR